MMIKITYGICTALVLFSSAMISSAKVVNTVSDSGSCVSSIHLVKRQIPMLVQALTFITDPTDKAVLAYIIATLQRVGTVEQSDLEKIIYELGINRSFFSGVVSARGDFGHAYFFPRLPWSFWCSHYGPGASMLKLPVVCSYWEVIDYLEYNRTAWCEVNGETIVQGNNSGIIIGGIGGFKRESGEELGYPYFEYYVAAILIIVRSSV